MGCLEARETISSVCSPRIERSICKRCGSALAYVYVTGSLKKYCEECRLAIMREQGEKFRQSPKAKAAKAKYQVGYRQTTEGKSAVARGSAKYRQSVEGKAIRARIMREYGQTSEGRAALTESQTKYRQTSGGKVAIAKRCAKHRERSTDPNSYVARVELLHTMQEPCAKCQALYKITHQIDHIVALCLGGTDEWDNLQPLCVKCHRKKSGEDIHELMSKHRGGTHG